MEVFPNWTFVPIVLLLMLLTYILNRTFFRPMQKTLDERASRIEGARKEAEEIRKSSQDRLADFDRRMREARREADQQMAQAKNDQQRRVRKAARRGRRRKVAPSLR